MPCKRPMIERERDSYPWPQPCFGLGLYNGQGADTSSVVV